MQILSKNKAVVVISSMHHDKAIDEKTEYNRKPVKIIIDNNQTKIGVDQLYHNYNIAKKYASWYGLTFLAEMPIACIKPTIPKQK